MTTALLLKRPSRWSWLPNRSSGFEQWTLTVTMALVAVWAILNVIACFYQTLAKIVMATALYGGFLGIGGILLGFVYLFTAIAWESPPYDFVNQRSGKLSRWGKVIIILTAAFVTALIVFTIIPTMIAAHAEVAKFW